jgi:hypothetical protein
MNSPHLYTTLPLPKFTHLPLALRTTNVGDDIQIECANRVFNVNSYVDRDDFSSWKEDMIIPFIGWYGYDDFIEPPKAQCFLFSLHFAAFVRRKILSNAKFLNWFKHTAKNQEFPVYARDIDTRDWIRGLGIDCEFGGCITSTLPTYDGERKGVIAVDVPYNIPGTQHQSMSNVIKNLPHLGALGRLKAAQEVLDKIQKAELVHTNRLHIALPCRAMGTPVKFYNHNIFEPYRLSGHNLIEGI